MKAELVIRERIVFDDGSLVEMVIWRVPRPVPPARHRFKYRLVYIVGGERRLGYDNERGKGDHRHIAGLEEPYQFQSIDRLLAEFVAGVNAIRSLT
jgi:hypothetical protein